MDVNGFLQNFNRKKERQMNLDHSDSANSEDVIRHLSQLNFSIFTKKLDELHGKNRPRDQHGKRRKMWLKIIRNTIRAADIQTVITFLYASKARTITNRNYLHTAIQKWKEHLQRRKEMRQTWSRFKDFALVANQRQIISDVKVKVHSLRAIHTSRYLTELPQYNSVDFGIFLKQMTALNDYPPPIEKKEQKNKSQKEEEEQTESSSSNQKEEETQSESVSNGEIEGEKVEHDSDEDDETVSDEKPLSENESYSSSLGSEKNNVLIDLQNNEYSESEYTNSIVNVSVQLAHKPSVDFNDDDGDEDESDQDNVRNKQSAKSSDLSSTTKTDSVQERSVEIETEGEHSKLNTSITISIPESVNSFFSKYDKKTFKVAFYVLLITIFITYITKSLIFYMNGTFARYREFEFNQTLPIYDPNYDVKVFINYSQILTDLEEPDVRDLLKAMAKELNVVKSRQNEIKEEVSLVKKIIRSFTK